MSETQHTSGPWIVVPENRAESRWVIGDGEGGSIASCEPSGPWITPKEADANARLVAAAPDMLAVLRCILLDLEAASVYELPRETVDKIRAAIAKTEPVAP